jgi:hypothetical protein
MAPCHNDWGESVMFQQGSKKSQKKNDTPDKSQSPEKQALNSPGL